MRPKTSFTLDLHKRCEKILIKLKRHNFSDVLVNQNDNRLDIPNFNKIEKSLKNNLYISVSQFGNNIRLLIMLLNIKFTYILEISSITYLLTTHQVTLIYIARFFFYLTYSKKAIKKLKTKSKRK